MPKLKKERTDIVQMTENVLVLYKEAHKDISISLEAEQPCIEFAFDPVQIKRVLINLLDNALGVVGREGRITIELQIHQAESTVALIVSDNGPGITEDVKMRLFEPYFSTRKSGTGLGLAIAHTIVSEHNGVIRVKDNTPSGAVFTVELPVDS